MVYRGKPSAGCENCRKAKKRCGLEQPSCERCVKLKKVCSGYRDTTALQIQDESESVKQKVERQKPRSGSSQFVASQFRAPPPPRKQPAVSSQLLPPTLTDTLAGIPTPGSVHSDSSNSTSSSDTIELDRDASITNTFTSSKITDITASNKNTDGGDFNNWIPTLTHPPPVKPDELATTYFFNRCTASYHWGFLQSLATSSNIDPCVDLAIKACGMAALGNVENVFGGKDYARSMYTFALGLLNEQLRDPKRSKTDESLIAVMLLGRYENLTCDGRQSIQSWKAHIQGSTQLLRVRGRAQFRSPIGRMMYREMRSQALINAIWEDQPVPSFFRSYQVDLETHPQNIVDQVIENLTKICFDFADLRANIRLRNISDVNAAEEAGELERKFIQWSIDTAACHDIWAYKTIDVEDSEHVWDGKVHSYWGPPAPNVWNSYRNMRIMLSRTQEWLCRRLQFSDAEREEQMYYFRRTRRQLTDEICAAVPGTLGHGSPAYSSPSPLVSAYGSIWPLFFAGTCALDRVGKDAWPIVKGKGVSSESQSNKSTAQALWIMGRLEYISKHVGLKWADGVVAVLRGDFKEAALALKPDSLPPTFMEKVGGAPWRLNIDMARRASRDHHTREATAEPGQAISDNQLDFEDTEMWPGKIPVPYPQLPNEREVSLHILET